MRTPGKIIADALRFDRDVSGNASRILDALEREGYAIVKRHAAGPRAVDVLAEARAAQHTAGF